MVIPFIISVAPKVIGTLGLASLSAATSNAINKSMNKNEHIIKLSDKELDDINKKLDEINKSKVFQKKITLQQRGSGILSFLLPILASTIIPSLIKGKGNNIFEEIKNKYPKLFEEKYYPLSNIFINDLLKNEKYFIGCYSKDNIPLIRNNESIITNTQNSYSNKIGH